jgi:hypothetical protein
MKEKNSEDLSHFSNPATYVLKSSNSGQNWGAWHKNAAYHIIYYWRVMDILLPAAMWLKIQPHLAAYSYSWPC